MDLFSKTFLAKKLLYQSTNRGCREIDYILGAFTRKHIASMDEKDLQDFALILSQNDLDIYDWITNKTNPPSHLDSNIMSLLLNFCTNHITK